MLRKSFTLIEMLIAVAIISILLTASVVGGLKWVSVSRDGQRKSDLYQIKRALEQYYIDHDTYKIANAGWHDGGQGWFAYEDGSITSYPKSIARKLYEDGYLKRIIKDPLFWKLASDGQRYEYMLYLCKDNGTDGQIFSVSAKLENPTDAEKEQIKGTCNGYSEVPVPPNNSTSVRYLRNYAVGNTYDCTSTSCTPLPM